jgi:predicted nucleic acid-binding protein
VELADTSAWMSSQRSDATRDDFGRKLTLGEIATCDMVKLELLVDTRSAGELAARRDELEHLRTAPMGERVWRRALDVLEALAERDALHHRQVPVQDLLIAAAAECAELPVLHYDGHFELIASVTGQPVRAIAPLGSL